MTSGADPLPIAELHPGYTGFFECFNRCEYFLAHEVLEELWLRVRKEPVGNFYKGLIQLAGAFVHIQKARRGPALALLELAEKNLSLYPSPFERLDTLATRALIGDWQRRLQQEGLVVGVLEQAAAPRLGLLG
jgi:hypothetical protein